MAPKKVKGKGKGKAKGGAAEIAIAESAKTAPPKPKKIPPPPAIFKAEDLARFKEMFKAHDETKTELMPLPMIPLMLRKLGFNPKGAEIQALFEMFLEDEFVDTVLYHEFLQMIEAKLMMGDHFEREVTQAFAVLGHDDEETGVCLMEVLKKELFTWGEPLQEIEFKDFLKLAVKDKTYNVLDGTFMYPKFIENLNNKDERYIKEPVNFFKLDQKTLAQMAIEKAAAEKLEQDRKEEEKRVKEEAKRQRMIAAGLILE